MASDGFCRALRLAWVRYLSNVNNCSYKKSSPVCREKLVKFAFGVSGRQKVKQITENISSRVEKACTMVTRQCNVIVGQRVWRAFQIASWYQRLYGEKQLLQTLRANLLRHCRNRNLYMLLGAAGIFQWERDGISDEELNRSLQEMEAMEKLVNHAAQTHTKHTPAPEGWEIVIDHAHLKVWRRYMKEHNLFEYRVYGYFDDITPMSFYYTQMDLMFWCGWDPQTMEINVVDSKTEVGSQVIHWIYKYPYPMYPRDYCYVRRNLVDEERNRIVIRAKAVSHCKCPEMEKVVRVKQYQSQLVIEPHTTFNEEGMVYYLTYFDDPQTQLPSVCYNWLASTGVPDFVERLHTASKAMQERTRRGYHPNVQMAAHAGSKPQLAEAMTNIQQQQYL